MLRTITAASTVRRARQIQKEVDQIFANVAHWNDCVRAPEEACLDPDPHGELARIRQTCAVLIGAATAGSRN